MKRLLVVSLLLAAVLALRATPAGAHADGFPTSFVPADGSVVAEAPAVLEVGFSLPPERMSATLSNAEGAQVDVVATVDGSERVVLTPAAPLTEGIWLVAFDVDFTHPDHGDSTVAGGWSFVVGSGGELAAVPALPTTSARLDALTDPFALAGFALTLAGVVALTFAWRRRPRLADAAVVAIVLGLAPALIGVVTAESEPVLERTEGTAGRVDIDGVGSVDVVVARSGEDDWSLQADFLDAYPISLRVWAAVAEPVSDAGGTPVNELAFIDTTAAGRFTLDFMLDAPGRWQVVLLPTDPQFRTAHGSIWVDQP
mgnify:FL=1